jgi:predicted Zn-ribbon and HTH transcriptional regulator
VPILRVFVCNGCGTVQADIEKPGQCRRCDSEYVEELDPENQAFDYFTGQ